MLSPTERATRDDLTASLAQTYSQALFRARNECSSLNPDHFLDPTATRNRFRLYERAGRGEELFLLSDFIWQAGQKHFATVPGAWTNPRAIS